MPLIPALREMEAGEPPSGSGPPYPGSDSKFQAIKWDLATNNNNSSNNKEIKDYEK